MNFDLLNFIQSSPLLTLGSTGGVIMVGYIATQWWAVSSRSRLEKKRSQLELDVIRTKIDILNKKAEAAPEVAWNGWRKFTVSKKVKECHDTFSIYLSPHDGKQLSNFKPGQYLTFQIQRPGVAKPDVRCYSLSDGLVDGNHYRVTIKRAQPYKSTRRKEPFDPGAVGIISSYFCDDIQEGDILDVKAPAGHFYLDVDVDRPVVLLGGGIGVTPMVAMARVLAHLGDTRKIHFFFGCRNGDDHMFKDEMVAIEKANPNLELHVCYSKPKDTDDRSAYKHESRVTVELLDQILPSNNFQYYLCGPEPFMDSLVSGLLYWGVPLDDLYYEAFGPAQPKIPDEFKKKPAAAVAGMAKPKITFAGSGTSGEWDPSEENMVEVCDAHCPTIEAKWACKTGALGCCETPIKSGEVTYPNGAPGYDVESGCCLPCVACPKGDLVLEA